MQDKFDEHLDNFRRFKRLIPVYGAILMDEACTRVLLVSALWSSSGLLLTFDAAACAGVPLVKSGQEHCEVEGGCPLGFQTRCLPLPVTSSRYTPGRQCVSVL